ncbi:hypothetical protein CC78DRAFT_530264 [Lojkania enalia]|uniref:Uncharacterized protein n=1 Tax=Lojkania enalia TaxID=147567 RepID=A0A9P4N3E4_9PLEO|nr:hypothetical protein CC78DRAFT_530264 [Didymosphaeria enalia]
MIQKCIPGSFDHRTPTSQPYGDLLPSEARHRYIHFVSSSAPTTIALSPISQDNTYVSSLHPLPDPATDATPHQASSQPYTHIHIPPVLGKISGSSSSQYAPIAYFHDRPRKELPR